MNSRVNLFKSGDRVCWTILKTLIQSGTVIEVMFRDSEDDIVEYKIQRDDGVEVTHSEGRLRLVFSQKENRSNILPFRLKNSTVSVFPDGSLPGRMLKDPLERWTP